MQRREKRGERAESIDRLASIGVVTPRFRLTRYFFNYLYDHSPPPGYRYAFDGTILIGLRGSGRATKETNESSRNYADRSTLAQLALIISCFINQTSSRRDRNFRDYERRPSLPTAASPTLPPCPTSQLTSFLRSLLSKIHPSFPNREIEPSPSPVY